MADADDHSRSRPRVVRRVRRRTPTVIQWHYESFAVPAAAELIASSAACAQQAFAIDTLLAMQFTSKSTPRSTRCGSAPAVRELSRSPGEPPRYADGERDGGADGESDDGEPETGRCDLFPLRDITKAASGSGSPSKQYQRITACASATRESTPSRAL